MTDTAAFVRNGRLDILAANPLGYALYSPVFDSPASAAHQALGILASWAATHHQTEQLDTAHPRDGHASG